MPDEKARNGDAELPRTAREIAVGLVDAGFGFACEFNANPAHHASLYDHGEELIERFRDTALRELRAEIEDCIHDIERLLNSVSTAEAEVDRLNARVTRVQDESGCGDFVEHIKRQREWSLHTFGPGARTAGLLAHIRKELTEIESAPDDVTEWIDVVILAIDGAWRAGHSPETIAAALADKQARNEARKWPDWRTADPNRPIEHDRSADGPISAECVLWP